MVRMFMQIFESFLSKLEELIADSALDNVKSIKDFELTLKSLQKNLKSLSAKASDVKEEIENAEASGQKKRKREVEEWLEEVELIENEVVELGREVESAGFISRLMGGGNAEQLNKQVDKLVEQSRNFGELLLDVRGSRGVSLLTTRMVGRAFEQNLGRIWSLLEMGEVPSIGIHGMGGAGKTTLAKHIHNRLHAQSQGRVFWVTVSQEFTIKSLQDKIAKFLGVKFEDEDEEAIRAGKLHEALSGMKKSVLILDDVWEYIDLSRVGCLFSAECCRLIITSRLSDVCRQIGCQEVIAVKKLDRDEAWKLFSETFTLGNESKLCPQAKEIAKSVANLCDGLPLGIITLAGSMRGEKSIRTWENALAELKESVVRQDGMGKGEIFEVLKYSFDRLNKKPDESQSKEELNMFQLCFLYCSLFPEDHQIPRNELVGKLISEGLLDQRKSRRAQLDQRKSRRAQLDQGYCVLDKLVKVCLLESCVDFYGAESVKMHDLVRGMALQIVGGKYMVRAGDYSLKEIPMEEEWTMDLEKVSLMKTRIWDIPDRTSPNCPKLSTLLLHDNFSLNFIPDSFFSKMQGLCTLDLSATLIKMLPNSVSELKSLKALLLENCKILESVPYLGKLKALRELNLDGTAIKEVPEGVEELLNLKFLSLDAKRLEMLPQGLLLKLLRLQYVKFPYHLEVAIEEIKNLKGLEELWARMKNVRDFNRYTESRQIPRHGAFYKIQVGEELYKYFDEEWVYFGAYDRLLIMSKCSLKDEKVLGQDIQCLMISQCEGVSNFFLDGFSPSNYPCSLQKLIIDSCGGIECVFTSEQELASQISKTLECIQLSWLDDLKAAAAGEIGPQAVFTSLRRLEINECNKMRKLGLPASGVPNLEEISIMDCSEIEEIFEDEGRADSLTITLPKLQYLSLYFLPRLKNVCKATIICNSIQEMKMWDCPRLMKKLPLHLDDPPPPTLTSIVVEREWWESLEWDNPNLLHHLQFLVEFP
ncbi:hypothetical protein C2S51_006934 [Perilla frutescens var. frutescens]|nr:hypothetical protein C2S51_006934 [Perilla frutescens var. frutescens]